MNRIAGRLTVAICVLTAVWVCGCSSSKSVPGPDVPLDTVREECRTLKPEELREKAIIYRDLIRKALKEQDEIDQNIAKAQSEEASEETINKLSADFEKVEKTRAGLMARYEIYIPAVRNAGIKLDDLRIEEPSTEPLPAVNFPVLPTPLTR